MKLTTTEVADYTTRLYRALHKLSGHKIDNSDFVMVMTREDSSPFLTDGRVKIFVAPMWSEWVHYQIYGNASGFIDAAKYGWGSIQVQVDDIITHHVKIPLTLSFDIKRDVQKFLSKVGEIRSITFTPPKEPELEVVVGKTTFKSLYPSQV